MAQINAIKNTSFASSALQLQSYSDALKDIEPQQAALLMSTQGLTNAEIQQALALRTDAQGHKLLSSSLQYNAMETAGLLSAKKTLTMAEIEETAQTILGSDADIEAAISAMNLSIVTDEQGVAKATLTKENLLNILVRQSRPSGVA